MASLATTDFVPLATTKVPNARLLPGACSPDKDLFLLVTRAQNKDRLALWKIKGAKKWEVEVCNELPEPESIAAIAWSPDGLTILVAHHPPRLSLHSIQDGQELQSIPLRVDNSHLTGVWWLKNTPQPVPEVWKREELIPGSALSTLQNLPLLDPFKDYYQPSNEGFSFGAQATRKRTPALPPVIASWPALSRNLVQSSIAPSEFTPQDQQDDDENLDRDSLVIAADASGTLHCFLDGVFPLGTLSLGTPCTVASLYTRTPNPSRFLLHAQRGEGCGTNARPWPVHLATPRRDVAQASSAARDLVWYTMRVLREMRETWVGTGTGNAEGVAGLGKRWMAGLEGRIKAHTSQPPHPILDLTTLLTTGRISDGLHDMLTGAEKMSGPDRPVPLSKWETSMNDALVKLRDYAERRVYPACQRLLVVLQDVRGWSQLPHQYGAFEIDGSAVNEAIVRVRRACELSVWLASVTRDELERFRNFIAWLKTETMNASSETTTVYAIKHDVLEVNEYIAHGLMGSVIDAWFAGGEKGKIPQVSPSARRVPPVVKNLSSVLEETKIALKDLQSGKKQPTDYMNVGQEIESLDRNLEVLMNDVAERCRDIFAKAAGAATRAATLPEGVLSATHAMQASLPQVTMCDRVRETDGLHYAAVYNVSSRKLFIQRLSDERLETAVLDVVVESGPADIVAMDFFDDETLAVALRPANANRIYLALVDYISVDYAFLPPADAREHYIVVAQDLDGVPLPIRQSRELHMRVPHEEGEVQIAVNGRVGRRVGCVYASATGDLETFDLEGEEEGEDEDMQDVSY